MSFYTKNDIIYQKLKDKIIDGELRSGERVVISELASEFDVSPMPVREAIKRLQQDGFVEVIPHVGAKITTFDLDRFKEIALIRMELEPLAVKLITPYISDDKIKELEKVISKMERAVEDKDHSQYAHLNKEFHATIYSVGPYQYLCELVMTLWAKSEFSRTIFNKFFNRLDVSLSEHKALLQAIKDRDSERACEVQRKHKKNAFEVLIDTYEKASMNRTKNTL